MQTHDGNSERERELTKGWRVLGHETAVHLLRRTLSSTNSVAAGNSTHTAYTGPRHAYLFIGPRHIGKTTLAQTYAKALLCSGTNEAGVDGDGLAFAGRPCDACRSCRLVDSGNHPDLRKIQPIDKDGVINRGNGMLRVEQAGDVVHEAALSPLESRYKCFIIQDIHTANASFANKLLKTLEEPPAHVILLVTGLDRSSLLPTIVSRCQVLELRPLDQQVIAKALEEGWHLESENADLLARLSNGRMGWAIEQIGDENAWQWRREQLDMLRQLITSDRVSRLNYVESLAAKRNQQTLFSVLELWTLWWRDVMLAQSGCLDACVNVDLQNEIEKLAGLVAPAVVQAYIRTLRQIEDYLKHTTNLRLALDVLLLQLPST